MGEARVRTAHREFKRTLSDVDTSFMAQRPWRGFSLLIGVLSLVASSCGLGDEASVGAPDESAAATTTLRSGEPIESASESLPRSLAADSADPTSGTDIALAVSAGPAAGDVVHVVAEIQSVDGDHLASPQVLLNLGDEVELVEGGRPCPAISSADACVVASDDWLQDIVWIDLTFRVAHGSSDPSVTLTAVSDPSIGQDPDLSNNIVTVVFVENPTTGEPTVPSPDEPPAPDDGTFEFTIEVHTDGCGVFRTGQIGDDLTWVVTDEDGFQVLGRNAAGETQYRYFRAGTYTVYLETWGGDYYVPVSNEVTINC